MEELSKLLIKLRGKESLRDVADRSGKRISHSYLNILEKGYDPRSGKPVKPTPETLRVISELYEYSYEELMTVAGYLDREQLTVSEEERRRLEVEEAKAKLRKVLGYSAAESRDRFSTNDDLILELAKVVESAETEHDERNKK